MSNMFLATCPKGFEPLLVDELISFGAQGVKQVAVGVQFYGGILSVLWHNSSLNTIVERRAFDSLLDIR